MSAKEQRIDKNELSEELARIAKVIEKGEEIEEEYGEISTTDFKDLYTLEGINGTKKGREEYSYKELYKHFADLYSKFIISIMFEYARKTEQTGIEYINILLHDGHFLILEGEEGQVVIPHPSALASTHLHPNVCIFSYKDLETADQLFIRGYLAVGVLTTNCLLLLYRNGVYTIDDREKLLLLSRSVRKSKTADEVIMAYNSVKFLQLSFHFVRFA
mgnify:CR=1 FL=1